MEIFLSLKISTERIHHIIHEYLDVRKLYAKWMPRERRQVDESEQSLKMIKRDKPEFFRRYVTMTWFHYFTPKSNRQSSEWTAHTPKEMQQSIGKVMASVFWDTHGIIFNDYLEKGRTINSNYFITLLELLKDEIVEKRPHYKKKKALLHQDNTPYHMSVVAETEAYFEAKDKSYFKYGIKKLEGRYNQCITIERNYVE
ncbi:hypothetical protein GWI33_007840 [Rhynchophorus ferrugineus]|uniref:Transposase n=1 Tax=Rhynchophorus ferrugineus TaxID=354439 RepID=A0A834MDA0_RHYFE|nr:hypothetical protein GWI33_007840 [Rhynchophorus ferrugineus]